MSTSENPLRGPDGPSIIPNYKKRKIDYYAMASSDLQHLGSLTTQAGVSLSFGSVFLGVAVSVILTHQYASPELKNANGWMSGAGYACLVFAVLLFLDFGRSLWKRGNLLKEIEKSSV